MRRWAPALAAVFVVASSRVAPAGGETTSAAEATEPGRKLDRALDLVLDASTRVPTGPRTLALVVDPSPSLASAQLPERLEAALSRHAEHLARTEVLVARVGAKDAVVLDPTADRAAVARTVRDVVRGARNETRNVYADLRTAAAAMGGRPGAREALLVTLENGDAEDDVEGTVRALDHGNVRTFVLAKETFLSDSYWASHPRTASPKGTTWTGGDAAFPEIPWGFVLQVGSANEEASSGFAPYGLTRLAAATGGRVFLYDDPSSQHRCSITGACRFCAGVTNDHAPSGEGYVAARVKALAPLALARDDAIQAAGRDPAYRLVLATWKQLADAGLVRSKPSLEGGGGAWKLARSTTGTALPLTSIGLALATGVGRASKALEACERIRAEHEAALAKLPEDASPRGRAIAEYVRLMLLVTRANLLQYGAWCQEAGPAIVGRRDKDRPLDPPEVPWRAGTDLRYVGVSFTGLSLCHGVAPVKELFLPGGAALDRALDDLDGAMKAYLAHYGGTAFGIAARRITIADFLPLVQGKVVPIPRAPNGGSTAAPPVTTNDRPAREGGGGDASGPTTSGG